MMDEDYVDIMETHQCTTGNEIIWLEEVTFSFFFNERIGEILGKE